MTPDALMRRAIRLSQRGYPAPNPHVGCVIWRDGEVVGEGYHHHAGGPHAERVALAQAGSRAEGGDVFTTLEPCNHTGRTGPCAEALIEGRVRRVYIACPDPNPVAAGGAARLVAAGIEVISGVETAAAELANERFLTAVRRGRPFVTVKAAASLDGRIALPSGESKWITGPRARTQGHRLRAEMGAVLVGYRTVLADDPELTARIPGVINPPVRVVIDPHHRLSGQERIFNSAAPTIHITGEFTVPSLLADLFARGITGLLVEGGGRTIGGFFAARMVDAVELFVAPKLLGAGTTWLEGAVTSSMDAAPSLDRVKIRRLAPDLWISGRLSQSP